MMTIDKRLFCEIWIFDYVHYHHEFSQKYDYNWNKDKSLQYVDICMTAPIVLYSAIGLIVTLSAGGGRGGVNMSSSVN
jgi:hypothetical protein